MMGARAKAASKVQIKKALPFYGGGKLAAGTEITITEEWDTIPPNVRGRLILDSAGERRLVTMEDLDYALGAH
jgi:hypothetical protein